MTRYGRSECVHGEMVEALHSSKESEQECLGPEVFKDVLQNCCSSCLAESTLEVWGASKFCVDVAVRLKLLLREAEHPRTVKYLSKAFAALTVDPLTQDDQNTAYECDPSIN